MSLTNPESDSLDASNHPATPAAILVEWGRKQEAWLGRLVEGVLTHHAVPPEDVLAEVYDLLVGNTSPDSALELDNPAASNDEPSHAEVVLRRLVHLYGVNALADGQALEFNRHLTLVFGRNASGKTGYSRLLKAVAGARSVEPILPDVHAGESREPAATFDLTVGGQNVSVTWDGQVAVAPLDQVCVFDSAGAEIHADDELGFRYVPAELSMFDHVGAAVSEMEQRLEDEMKRRRPDTSTFCARFTEGTAVHDLLVPPSAETDLDALRDLAGAAPDDSTFTDLQDRVKALRSNDVGSRLSMLRQEKEFLQGAKDFADAVLGWNHEAYNELVRALDASKAKLEVEGVHRFSADEAPSGLTDAWQGLITAAQAYIEESEHPGYPAEGDACVYCRQALDGSARNLLEKYGEYLSGSSRRDMLEVERQLRGAAESFDVLDSDRLGAWLESRRRSRSEDDEIPVADASVGALLEHYEQVSKSVEAHEGVEVDELVAATAVVRRHVEPALKDVASTISALEQGAESRTALLQQAGANLAEARDRRLLAECIDELTSLVGELTWVDQAEETRRGLSTVRRSLTDAAKRASEAAINRDFDGRFREESDRLNAPYVELSFPGRKGQTLRHKTLPGGHTPGPVLSEGERKVIALADFLAESGLRGDSAPVVFDDPVNSLDYERIGQVAHRIADLARSTQVVVFTHNALFATSLVELFEKGEDEDMMTIVGVYRDRQGRAGVVTDATDIRIESLGTLRDQIERQIQQARKLEGFAQEGAVADAYDTLRTWCEAFVERKLLEGVVMRQNPAVKMGQLEKIDSATFDEVRSMVHGIWERACRAITSHSQPTESLTARPGIEDLEEEWKLAQRARDVYRAG